MSKQSQVIQASAVSIGGRALVIIGKPGTGKSTLALALIDRGAILIGDDGLAIEREGEAIIAHPPPNITGMLEIRGVGIIELPTTSAPIALILDLDGDPQRLPETLPTRELGGLHVPVLAFDARAPSHAIRAEWALALHGLSLP